MIPDFDETSGYLPKGEHNAGLAEFQQRFAWNGRRLKLFGGLQAVIAQLWAAGVDEIYIAGSFCTAAPLPNDIDGFWVYKQGIDTSKIDPVVLQMNTHAIDPVTGRVTRVMKIKYGVEFFMETPNFRLDGMTLREFFSRSRDGSPRGLIRLRKEGEA